MKIKTKLIVSSTVLLAGVAAMAATGLLLVKGIETHVHGLTDETVPLYTDVLRLRYTVQDMASDFFELGKAQDLAQLEQVSNKIVANIQTAESISDDLRRYFFLNIICCQFFGHSRLWIALGKTGNLTG